MSLTRVSWIAALAAAAVVQSAVAAQRPPPVPGALPPACDRACLYGFIDRYLEALVHKEPGKLPWAANARFTENNVELSIGDGLWSTVTGLGDYKLKFADVSTGQAGFYGVVKETVTTSGFSVRMKVEGGKISELETVILRVADMGALGPGENPFNKGTFLDKPILLQDVPPNQRRARERMISPMIVAWFRSPPGEASRTMSPGARLAWSSLSRNSAAAAGPIVPLTKSARRPCAAPSRSTLSISEKVRLGETYWSFQ